MGCRGLFAYILRISRAGNVNQLCEKPKGVHCTGCSSKAKKNEGQAKWKKKTVKKFVANNGLQKKKKFLIRADEKFFSYMV